MCGPTCIEAANGLRWQFSSVRFMLPSLNIANAKEKKERERVRGIVVFVSAKRIVRRVVIP